MSSRENACAIFTKLLYFNFVNYICDSKLFYSLLFSDYYQVSVKYIMTLLYPIISSTE